MRRTPSEILDRSDINQTNEILCALCTMKHNHGGLGLRSARRTAPAAYWASIADTIPEIQKRYPRFAQRIVQWLNSSDSIPHSMAEAAEARRHLINSGYHRCPGWQDIAAGIRWLIIITFNIVFWVVWSCLLIAIVVWMCTTNNISGWCVRSTTPTHTSTTVVTITHQPLQLIKAI